MGIYGYMGEREQRQQVCVKLLAKTGAEPLSPRAVVILARGMSQFPVPKSTQASCKLLGGWLSVSPPGCLIAAGGTGEGLTFPFQLRIFLALLQSPRNSYQKCKWLGRGSEFGRELRELVVPQFLRPPMGIMQFPCAPPFSQVSRVLREPLGKCCTPMAVAELKAALCCNDIAPYGAFQPRFSP